MRDKVKLARPVKATPMIKQYLSIKDRYADAILLYRMGDFYEMFFEDAEIAARLLDIALTSRNKKDVSPVPMCGVPHHAVQGYIAKLLEHGHKVALCDQVEDPAAAKGLVKREVVRVITPGMIVENAFLDEKADNFLLAATRFRAVYGLSYLDLSTGIFRLCETPDADALGDEIRRVAPSEILLPETLTDDALAASLQEVFEKTAVTYLEDEAFEPQRGRRRLLEQFNTLSLEGFGCERRHAGVGAAGALLAYVRKTQKQRAPHLTGIESYALDHYLWIDDVSVRNLELFANLQNGSRRQTLIHVIDRTVSAMGGRLLKRWLRYPLIDAAEIQQRLDAVAEARQQKAACDAIRGGLKAVADLERLGSRIAMDQCHARDLLALKRSLEELPGIWEHLATLSSRLFQWDPDFSALHAVSHRIGRAIRDDAPPVLNKGGIIRRGYHAELDELLDIGREGRGWLVQLEHKERERTGINTLKVRFNKVFGYYIEVPKSRAADVPGHYVRKQTLVSSERYITDELKTFEQKVMGAEQRRIALEYELFRQVRAEAAAVHALIAQTARFLARLDCILGLAVVAEERNFCRPVINAADRIEIEDGRHPVVETLVAGERFVPNSITLDNDSQQVLIITGPNMAGKSTVLRQVALTVLMAQVGSCVPARRASLCITDRIFTRVGALDNLSGGQSTFLVEMQETANILNNATSRSLVVMDEIGRGTSTFDGLSIAWAVAAHLHDLHGRGVKTLFATHYHELTQLAASKARVKNFNIAVKEWNDEIIFLHRIVEGGTNRSYGIQVARLAGIPHAVIDNARKVLARIENGDHCLTPVDAAPPEGTAQRQMPLFEKPQTKLIEKLKQLDIARMTPLEAMNCLHELQQGAAAL